MSLTISSVPGTFLALLDDAERLALLELGAGREFARGAILMYEGEPGERVMVLASGRVKMTRIEPGGHETLLSICDPGDILGELSLIDERPRLATVTALEPVRVLVITASVFRAHLERAPRVAIALLEVETRRFRETTLKLSQFLGSDTVGRLAARIVELSERYGARREGEIEIGLALSQDELAAWTGASRAGVAKAFQTLRKLGWIETHRRRLVVRELDALRERAV
ncbi:MAG TPA: Crp/Fnr family transcriptional regulator [Solirubrobacteraceae bacterium]|jgi:CRP-like cAMP-binding protein